MTDASPTRRAADRAATAAAGDAAAPEPRAGHAAFAQGAARAWARVAAVGDRRRAVLRAAAAASDRAARNSTTPATARRRTGWPTCHATIPACRATSPQLGPPLPGDLGRPMVNAGAAAPGMPQPAAGPSPEQQRIAQEQEAARTSHLFATTNTGQTVSRRVVPAAAALPGAAADAAGRSADLTSQDHKLAFLNGNVDRRTVSPDRVEAPASPYVLQAGAVIPAALITGLRSDLPGQVTAQVTENVYDSPTGRILLIPQGARLDRPIRRPGRLRPIAGAAGLEPPDHAERPLDRAGTPARRRRGGLCRPGGPGR